MAWFSRIDLAKGFSVYREEVRETARRQFWISAVLVFTVLMVAWVDYRRDPFKQTADAAKADASRSAVPIKAGVRYVDGTSAVPGVAVASTAK